MLVHLVFPLAIFEGLDILKDTGGQPVLLDLITRLLALTFGLLLTVQELLGLQFHFLAVANLQHLFLSMSIILSDDRHARGLLPHVITGDDHCDHVLPETDSSAQSLVQVELLNL